MEDYGTLDLKCCEETGSIVRGSHGQTWRVVAAVGRGTCCSVYEAHLVGGELRAALKVYKKGAGYEAAHAREALVLGLARAEYGQLPEIVQVWDCFIHEGHPCLVQELCDCDIRQLLYKVQSLRTGLSWYLIQKLAGDILRGLQPFHKKGFVHADVKPGNILWSPECGCMKLVDFGLTFNTHDKVVGQVQTPGYRAPEIDRWNRNVASAVPGQFDLGDEACTCGRSDVKHGDEAQPSRDDGERNDVEEKPSNRPQAMKGVSCGTANCEENPARTQVPKLSGDDPVLKRTRYMRGDSSMSAETTDSSNRTTVSVLAPSAPTEHPADQLQHARGLSLSSVQTDRLLGQSDCTSCEASANTTQLSNSTDSPQFRIQQEGVSACKTHSRRDMIPPTNEGLELTKESVEEDGDTSKDLSCIQSRCCRSRLGVGTAADMWSVGCLLVEMYTGEKLFSSDIQTLLQAATSEAESNTLLQGIVQKLLRPRDGDDKIKGHSSALTHLEDLVNRLLTVNPSERISAEASLHHEFLALPLEAEFDDLILLPTRILRLVNAVDESELATQERYEETLDDLEMELRNYGTVLSCLIPRDGRGRGLVFVEYEHAYQATEAYHHVCRRTFAGRTLLLTYFRPDHFLAGNLY